MNDKTTFNVSDDVKVDMDVSNSKSVSMDISGGIVVKTNDDYEKLKNKPTLDGETIIGAMFEKDPTVSKWAKESKKPQYTADEIGAVSKEEVETLNIKDLNALWDEL